MLPLPDEPEPEEPLPEDPLPLPELPLPVEPFPEDPLPEEPDPPLPEEPLPLPPDDPLPDVPLPDPLLPDVPLPLAPPDEAPPDEVPPDEVPDPEVVPPEEVVPPDEAVPDEVVPDEEVLADPPPPSRNWALGVAQPLSHNGTSNARMPGSPAYLPGPPELRNADLGWGRCAKSEPFDRAKIAIGLRSLGACFQRAQYNAATITGVITDAQNGRYRQTKDALSGTDSAHSLPGTNTFGGAVCIQIR